MKKTLTHLPENKKSELEKMSEQDYRMDRIK
jgi:hypothetical protein